MIKHEVPEWRAVRRDWLLHAMGHTKQSVSRPLVAIVNSWSEMNPGHYHLRDLAESVKRGVLMAGGTPLEFNTASICDGFVVDKGLVLPFRDLIAFSVEMMLRANSFSGAVFLSTCDKNVPAHLMAAARVNLPSIFVTGGPMLPGYFEGRDIVCCTDGRPMIGRYMAGELSPAEFERFSLESHGSVGACGMMGTANTMQCLVEGLGLSLPGCASTPAVSPGKSRYAEESGRQVMELIAADIRPDRILTPAAMDNAIRLLLALGGSTNAILHLSALSGETGHQLELERFEQLSREIPFICNVKPSGTYTLLDFHRAGGVPAVLKQLEPQLEPEARSVTGKSLGENLKSVPATVGEVIRPAAEPLRGDGGIVVIRGNLAPNGGVVKQTAFPESRFQHTGRARVFESIKTVEQGLSDGVLELDPEEVLVLRNQGPRGAPGMPETHVPPVFYAKGLADMLIVTDGRTSGSTRGPMVLHVAPEAAAGGPLGIVRDGDPVRIDIPNRKLELLILPEEYQRRLEVFAEEGSTPTRPASGWMELYTALVGCASTGARLRPEHRQQAAVPGLPKENR